MLLYERTLPRIEVCFQDLQDAHGSLYCSAIRAILGKMLPEDLFNGAESDLDAQADQREQFHALLPLMHHALSETVPACLSFHMLYKSRPNAFKFFFEMISRWLVPGKQLNVLLVYAVDFKMPDVSPDLYTLCEVKVRVDDEADLEKLQHNLPIIETQARLGVQTANYARRILDIKGQALDDKTAVVQDYVVYLIKRRPQDFDVDLMSEMQHVLVICRDDFKTARGSRHLSRVISIHYLFRKALREAVKLSPEMRHLSLKLFRAKLRLPAGEKPVLALLVGVNFLDDKEVFEKSHLMKAIQNYVPSAQAVEDSFFANRRGSENICTLYLEIEKRNGEEFTTEEILSLRRELPIDLKDRIEHLMHPVFMPRNEEEIMRNVLSLSSQIRFMRDIPQVIISFDEQTHSSLFFTVILVRVLKEDDWSIEQLFQQAETFLTYFHDQEKIVGHLRNKYPKEATIFRVQLPKEGFLRRDHSIDLYKARQAVFSELCRLIGELRDFNGGMISKQNELLCTLRQQLGDKARYNDLLLENFFYSLTPVVMRTVLAPDALQSLFLMQLDAIDRGFFNEEGYSLKIRNAPQYVYVMIKGQDRTIREELSRRLAKLQIPSTDLTNSFAKIYDASYIGYIYRSDDPTKRRDYCQIVHNVVQAWEHKK
jgi:hypothetical protein